MSDNYHRPPPPYQENVTPARAAELLQLNPRNRAVRLGHVRDLANAMRNGHWVYNGDAIGFDRDGFLIDGQHRLAAIVESGTTQLLVLQEGLLPEAQGTIDTGRKRMYSDHLAIAGHKSTHLLASVLLAFHRYQADGWKGAYVRVSMPPFAVLDEVLRQNPELVEYVQAAVNTRSRTKLPPTCLALSMWVFDRIDATDSTHFWARLVDGANLEPDSGILRLRAVLDGQAASNAKYETPHLQALVIKAWNAYRRGAPVRVLSYRPGGASPEAFPLPV